jgi:TP901-1 family phage major tail protein
MATHYAGKDMLLKQGTWSAGTVVGGFTTNTITINNQVINTSSKDLQFRTLIAGGIKSLTISGSGVASNDTGFETFKGYAQAASANALAIGSEDSDTVEATFIITSFEITGEYQGAQTFSFTAESVGTVTYTNA